MFRLGAVSMWEKRRIFPAKCFQQGNGKLLMRAPLNSDLPRIQIRGHKILDNRTNILYTTANRTIVLYLPMRTNSLYDGNVQIYLEGHGALQVIDAKRADCHKYYIGSPKSAILIKDYRSDPNQAAKAKLNGQTHDDFAEVFNQPAKIKVYKTLRGIEIQLRDGSPDIDSPILWLGITRNHQIPARKIHWKILKQISNTDEAFAILTSPISTT